MLTKTGQYEYCFVRVLQAHACACYGLRWMQQEPSDQDQRQVTCRLETIP
jgi:hypothetical protein